MEKSKKGTKKLVLKKTIKRPKTLHESEQHRIESKVKPPQAIPRDEPPEPVDAWQRRPREEVTGWREIRVNDPLIRRVMEHLETKELTAVTKNPVDDGKEMFVGDLGGPVPQRDGRVSAEQRARVWEVTEQVIRDEDELFEVPYTSIKHRAKKPHQETVDGGEHREGETVAERRRRLGEGEIDERGQEKGGKKEGLTEEGSPQSETVASTHSHQAVNNNLAQPQSPGSSRESLTVTRTKRRTLPVFQNPRGDREAEKMSILPGLMCSTCAIGVECKEYQDGYACAYEKAFKAFPSRDVDNVLGGMRYIVDKNKERLMRAFHYEEAVNGGQLDTNVSHQSEVVIRQSQLLVELEQEQDRIRLEWEGDDPHEGGAVRKRGILSQLFGNQQPAPPIVTPVMDARPGLPSPRPTGMEAIQGRVIDVGVDVESHTPVHVPAPSVRKQMSIDDLLDDAEKK